jgi:uncharacterized protein (TIGR00369 family)
VFGRRRKLAPPSLAGQVGGANTLRRMTESTASPERTRTFTWDDPMVCAAAAQAMSGEDFLAAMVRGEYPRPPIANALGFALVEVGDGTAVFEVTPAEYHYNPIGVVHGGLLATVLDSAMGCSVHSTIRQGAAYTTLELKVNYVRPATQRSGPLRCEARVLHRGKRSATAEGRVVDRDGRLYAHGTTTCLLMEAPSPRS